LKEKGGAKKMTFLNLKRKGTIEEKRQGTKSILRESRRKK